MFEVFYSNQARKFLKKAESALANRLLKKIEELRANPITRDTIRVEGYKEKTHRVRVGDYRVLYEVDYPQNSIGIIKIDKRPKAYQQ